MCSELGRQIRTLKHRDHICAVYDSDAEGLDIIIRFVKEGLARGDRCLFIADQITSDEIVNSLAVHDIDVPRAGELGALCFSSQRDTYLKFSTFNPHVMIDYLRQEEARALADGFSGLWFVGLMSWALGPEVDRDRLIEYESLLNLFLVNSQSVVLCLYGRTRFEPAVIHDVVRTHPLVILGEQVCPNPYFEPPDLMLCQETVASSEFKARRVDWWINQLKRARTVELEKERTREQLEVERARFEAVLRQMTAGVAVVEAPSGKLLLGNAQMEHIFRQELRSIQNIRDYETFKGFHTGGRPYRALEWPPARSILDGETVWDEEIDILRGDGSRGTIRVSSTPIHDRSGAIIAAVAICYDISAQKQANEAAAKYTAQLQGLARASLKIHSAGSPTMVAQSVTEAARDIVGAHLSVTGFTLDANWAQAVHCVSLSEKYAHWKDYDDKPNGSAVYALVCETNRPLRLTQAELEAHPSWRDYGKGAGKHVPLRGWLAAPLVGSDGSNVGLIQLSDKYQGDFTADDEAILAQLAQVASVAIENAWLYEQVEAARDRMQSLSAQVLAVQEIERRHLARELHDEVGQELTGLRLLLKPDGDLRSSLVNYRIEEARGVVDLLLERIRALSFDLRPAALDELGLLPALLALFERYTRQTGVQVTFKHDGVDERFEAEVETTAYRIIQEALTNVARHAGTGSVTVRVWATAEMLSLQVEDRGRGFDVETPLAQAASGGLTGMRERVALLAGQLAIESTPSTGTEITAELPLRRQRRT
jgi:signal transduction histidine kinase/PAS domain-containing protein